MGLCSIWDRSVPSKSHGVFVLLYLVAMDPFERCHVVLGDLNLVHDGGDFISDLTRSCPAGKELSCKFVCSLGSRLGLGEHEIPYLIPHFELVVGCLSVVVGFSPFCAFLQVFLGEGKGSLEMFA